jgi:hypothetical protein
MIQQSLASQGGTGCERDDLWYWDSPGGACAVNGQTLQFNVSGKYSLIYPNWIAGDCNPSMDASNPIADFLVFPFWQVTGTTLDAIPPTSWSQGSQLNLPNLALSLSGAVPAWSPWAKLGGYCTKGVAVSSWAPGRLDVFTIGGDGATWHIAWPGGVAWSGWQSLGGPAGGPCLSAPAAVSWGPNRIDIFVIGTDYALHHQWWNGSSWSGWAENLGGHCQLGVAAVSQGPNQLDVLVIGSGGKVYHRPFNGSAWGGWDEVSGGYSISAPAASAISGAIDLYVIGGDHAVYHNAWHDGGWQGFVTLGFYAVDGVAATTFPDVYTIGGDGHLYRNLWTGSAWSGWASLFGGCYSAPAAVSWGPGHIDTFAIGGDNACWHRWYG